MIRDDIVAFQRKVGPNGSIGEIDVETNNIIIEVTSSPKGKLPQITKCLSDKNINPAGKKVILYAPNCGKFAIRDIIRAGAFVAQNEAELLALIASLGGP